MPSQNNHVFNSNQLNFIIAKALEKYDAIPLPEGHSLNEEQYQSFLENKKIKLLGKGTRGLCQAISGDIEDAVKRNRNILGRDFLASWDRDNYDVEQNLRRFFERKTRHPNKPIIATIIYLLASKGSDLLESANNNEEKTLVKLKAELLTQYKDFPKEGSSQIEITIGRYRIFIFGDKTVKDEYDQIESQFNLWKGQVEPIFINTSDDSSKIYIEQLHRKEPFNGVIGIFILATDTFLSRRYKLEGENTLLSTLICNWAETYTEIPITYLCYSKQVKVCTEQLSGLGDPVIIPKGVKGTGVISIFIKAIERFKQVVKFVLRYSFSGITNVEFYRIGILVCADSNFVSDIHIFDGV